MSPSAKHPPFWLLAALLFTGYLLLPIVFPLIGQYNHAPLRDIRFFAPSALGGVAYALLFLALYALYVVAWRRVQQYGATLKSILASTILFSIPLLLTYPINATDIFRYFIRGRVTSLHGASALTTPPNAFPNDPYLILAGEWAGETSPYGPLWELLAGGTTSLVGDDLFTGLLAFKLIALLAHLIIAVIIWKATQGSHNKQAANALLWAWNPALLFMFVVDGHNDALMLLWLAAGHLLMRRRPLPGILVAVLAPLTKPIAALALPFLFLAQWRALESVRAQARYLLLTTAGVFMLTIATFYPLGSPLDLVRRLLTEASEAVGFSPGILLVLIGERFFPGIDILAAVNLGSSIGMLLFAAFALYLLWRVWRGMSALAAIAAAFASYLVTAFTFRIWYSTWTFIWPVMSREEQPRLLASGLWFLLTAHLSILIYGHLRVHLLGGDQLLAHLIGVPFTFLLPLLLAYRFPLTPARTG